MSEKIRRRSTGPRPSVSQPHGYSGDTSSTPVRPDGPKLSDEQAGQWAQHVERRLVAGEWQLAVEDFREWLRIGERQERHVVDWGREWPRSEITGPPIAGDALMIACGRVRLLLGYGLWSTAARALADAAESARERATAASWHQKLIDDLGYLPASQIDLDDLISDPWILGVLQAAGIGTVTRLVATSPKYLARIYLGGLRFEHIIADLDRCRVRHRFGSGRALQTA